MTQTELLKRKMELSLLTDIPDMRAYASAWLQLADEFTACGLVANGSYCKARGEFYAQQAQGHYVRTMQGCMAEIQMVTA